MSTWMSSKPLMMSGFAGLLLAAGGCVSADTHELLKVTNAKLLEDNKNLAADNALLRSRLSEQEAARGRLEAELARMQKDLMDALTKGGSDSDQVASYRRKIADLERQLGELASATPAAPPRGPLDDRPDIQNKLEALARGHGLTFDPRTGMLRFPSDLIFPSGQDTMLPGADAPLNKLAAIIDDPQIRDFHIRIIGHTDKRPIVHAETARRFPTNWHLSAARAIAVMAELLKNMEKGKDVASIERLKDRFEPGGRGQRDLIDKGNSEEANRKNRRVDIYFVPPTNRTIGATAAATGRTP